jgi:DNA-binding CsgD family transcriptional regulator
MAETVAAGNDTGREVSLGSGGAAGNALAEVFERCLDGLSGLRDEVGDLREGLSELRAMLEGWRAEWVLGELSGTRAPRRAIAYPIDRPERGEAVSGPARPGSGARPYAAARSGTDAITPREWAVPRLLADGAGNMAIAETLVISPLTVKTYIGKLRRKLRTDTRTGLVARARALGLL